MRGPIVLLCCVSLLSRAAAQVPAAEAQIAGALQAAPEALRADATVLGYTNYHRLATLKQGTNEMICLADDPSETSWQVSCYHKDLEPFMRRGRELRAQGLGRAQVDSARMAEIEAGSLKMPDGPRALFNVYAAADSVDPSGMARGTQSLQVVYVPYATTESTGLPSRPGGGLPWLMFPGKPWAHMMIMH